MATKKTAEKSGADKAVKKTVVRKAAVKKPAPLPEEPRKIEVSEADASRMEAELFGDFRTDDAATPAAPAVHHKGIVKKRHAEAETAPEPPAAPKSPLAGPSLKKTKIIRKGAVAPPEPPPPEPEPVPAAPADSEPMPVHDLSRPKILPHGHLLSAEVVLEKMKEREKKKDKEKEKEKRHEVKLDPKVFAPAEKSITVIREEGDQKAAVSYKEFAPAADGQEYEEVEEVVEEVIEEIEYADQFPEAEAAPKPAPEAPQSGFGQWNRRRKRRKKKTPEDVLAAKDAVKRTMAAIHVEDTASRKRYHKEGAEAVEAEVSNVLKVSDFMSVAEIANLMKAKPAEVIAACMKLGIMATMNQRLDFTTISALVDEFGFKAELMEEYTEETLTADPAAADKESLRHRSPIVTVMGHVDHGKTSLLDFIRKANVVAGEAGGITQHIGAYRVQTAHGPVTFLDTPGHEAFATMRARGAHATDLVILVVAADSHVMPQTVESIDHAKAAGVKIVVAINKMDLPTANAKQIRLELSQHGVYVEDFGGNTVAVEISCKSGQNIPKLLEMVATEAELLELKANPDRPALGTIVEARMDSRLGPVATVLVQNGTLRVGDNFVTGPHSGRVKLMTDEHGNRIDEAGPSVPVQVLGLSGTPRAGDSFSVVESEKVARDISVRRSQAEKERESRQIKHMSLDDLYSELKQGAKNLNIIVKGDVDGSVEALSDSLQKLTTDKLKVNVIHKSVGAIKESDVLLAATTNAIIIGFHVHPNSKVRELAEQEGVDIRLYKIIYEAIEELQKAAEGMLDAVEKEVILGSAEVRQIFKISKVGTIAGCMVVKGKAARAARVRVLRDSVAVIEGKVSALKRFKDEASEVLEGFECGISLENFNDIKAGDVLEFFEIQKIKATL